MYHGRKKEEGCTEGWEEEGRKEKVVFGLQKKPAKYRRLFLFS